MPWQVSLERTCFLPSQLPLEPGLREIVFSGRSNVGKSTLINALFGRKVAHISGTPGKTRSINYYRASLGEHAWHVVDVPGYGYAKRGKGERDSWLHLMETYFLKSPNIAVVMHLVDFRHGLLENDKMLQTWLHDLGLPLQVIFTKADKIARSKHRGLVEQYVKKGLYSLDKPYVTGAEKKLGIPELKRGIFSFLFPESDEE
ncbi:MAG TPA: ribosome biogenesis GTP-binding protein YihA/YsxC [Synergistaceae bacterium]|nr:ribosome biogenesis GTP-binding protein YihA/YsxC [Synergistaceae bacterium]HPJ25092.1 ribosome biogenesis GTP-binding protein YihA/YsxC [Synergistaceae bacterium]HPQ36571.1 ribosome biogenesis GTP-binding protein YihA/YsxC [Synergistaceae bacterium]